MPGEDVGEGLLRGDCAAQHPVRAPTTTQLRDRDVEELRLIDDGGETAGGQDDGSGYPGVRRADPTVARPLARPFPEPDSGGARGAENIRRPAYCRSGFLAQRAEPLARCDSGGQAPT